MMESKTSVRCWPESSTNATLRSMPSSDNEITALRNGMSALRGIKNTFSTLSPATESAPM